MTIRELQNIYWQSDLAGQNNKHVARFIKHILNDADVELTDIMEFIDITQKEALRI